jgi:hypothetical protein
MMVLASPPRAPAHPARGRTTARRRRMCKPAWLAPVLGIGGQLAGANELTLFSSHVLAISNRTDPVSTAPKRPIPTHLQNI